MPVEVALNTPLAEALHAEIQPKLVEVGWGSGEDTTLSEYILLMVVNGKTESEIAEELSGELLNLGSDDPSAKEFSRWLFEQIQVQNAKLNGGSAPAESHDQPAPASEDADMDVAMGAEGQGPVTAPTGPKAMRNGNGIGPRGVGRDKRMMGQISRAMDRAHDSILHRVRGQSGNERINTHNRMPPGAPRMGMGPAGRMPRGGMNNRAANIVHGLATGMGGMPTGPAAMAPGMNGMNGVNGMNGMNGMPGPWMMPGQGVPQAPQSMDVYAMLEHQSRLMEQMQRQLQQQMGMQHRPNGGFNQPRGKPLSDRIQHPRRDFRNGPQRQQEGGSQGQASSAESGGNGTLAETGGDVEMGGAKREPTNPEETLCKFNLSCTNRDCKFAHQSPAAPPGITIDVHDVCSFGAACKNRKCVARHPSPAQKMAHQNEQDCKFYPNCTNPHCPFRHPSMPPCRNGGDCSVPGCKFTHTKTMCKYHPCTNRYCTFKHEEGQKGIFPDKVWTADGSKEHVSDRKFVDEGAPEDPVIPTEQDKEMATEETAA